MSISTSNSQLELHRQQFPALANKTYFNYGGQGPIPQSAIEATNNAQEYIQTYGPFSTKVNSWIAQEVEETRKAIALELNTTSDTITLTEDVTVGCNIALWGIDWQKGDRILLTDCEHPGIIATVREIGRRFGVKIDTCPIMATLNQGDPVQVIEQHLLPRTRLVVLSHLLWNTGQVLPLDKIVKVCKAANVRILADAAQSVGSLPLNLTELGVDFYAFTGHKWWCGAAGVGGLYVHPEARESLQPTFIGWRGILMDSKGNPTGWQPDGRRYEVATSAYGQYAGLRAAIATHQKWGSAEERYQQICDLSKYLWQKLTQIPEIKCLKASPPEAGLVSFQVSNNRQLVEFLEAQNIMTRILLDPDCVRACVHYLTLTSEIDRLVAGIESFVSNI
ncbi:aminotransferase class V-fold PLP-dependent enzyme [Synechocystis sp. PCC 7509]|uniref:aminotransferase class V-fold PLP-dependent enzyme n=1 Tax=Synechocystis sp. PCC 7509 TaxID=927677 RepID=UPI0002ACA8A4|nr:aminotransferase class V-fold PLP-dependent enzyme [Synechocystis sp. PCC 7509]